MVKVTGCSNYHGNQYLEWCSHVLATIGDQIYFPQELALRERHYVVGPMPDTTPSNGDLAINYATNRSASPWCFCYDAQVGGACLATAEPDPNLRSLTGACKNPGATAGEIWHKIGGMIHGCGEKEAIIFTGIHIHAPLMPTPMRISKK